ncbi:MAG: hypothetical protein ACFCBW_09870, partial [Candidatus Competibacterales bacterium]
MARRWSADTPQGYGAAGGAPPTSHAPTTPTVDRDPEVAAATHGGGWWLKGVAAGSCLALGVALAGYYALGGGETAAVRPAPALEGTSYSGPTLKIAEPAPARPARPESSPRPQTTSNRPSNRHQTPGGSDTPGLASQPTAPPAPSAAVAVPPPSLEMPRIPEVRPRRDLSTLSSELTKAPGNALLAVPAAPWGSAPPTRTPTDAGDAPSLPFAIEDTGPTSQASRQGGIFVELKPTTDDPT